MTWLLACPICMQGLVLKGDGHAHQFRCPYCGGSIRVPNRRLSEGEIVDLIGPPPQTPTAQLDPATAPALAPRRRRVLTKA